mmetsp:Transcript_0/g.3  ORF Transcript_0/g.3 Transcript_0/m.3 type:complete len:110 (+) Transcript_0:103-432(+)
MLLNLNENKKTVQNLSKYLWSKSKTGRDGELINAIYCELYLKTVEHFQETLLDLLQLLFSKMCFELLAEIYLYRKICRNEAVKNFYHCPFHSFHIARIVSFIWVVIYND